MPVSKSDAGWRRLQARTRTRQGVRTAHMDHRVRSASAAKPKSVERIPELEEIELEFQAVSYCGDCDGPCTCG